MPKSSLLFLLSIGIACSGMTTVQSLHVAVIGAGASGLAAARVLSRNGMVPVVLEKQLAGGGVWDYVCSEEKPMYSGLRTNLPREIMAYREKPWLTPAEETSSYVTHGQVLQYLNDYKKDYELDRFIRYGSKVTQLTVLRSGEDPSNAKLGSEPLPKIRLEWETTSSDQEQQQQHSDIFDAVCIANGHYALPSFPDLPGLDEHFKGNIMHSMEYDSPESFAGQTVLCIGGRASGSDLARELSSHCQHVYLSDATCQVEETQDNVTCVPKTRSVNADGSVTFALNCSTQPQVDTIIFCTGYDYQFPFITADSNLDLTVTPGERRVMPLHEQLWHADVPNLTFLGLPHSVVPFPLFELQTEAIVGQLLSEDDDDSFMLDQKQRQQQAQRDAVSGGSTESGQIKDTHFLGGAQWDYLRQMAKVAQLYDGQMEQFIETNRAIYDHAGNERKNLFPGGKDVYRATLYRRHDTGAFDVLHSEFDPEAAVQ